jgi:hypothetical protein
MQCGNIICWSVYRFHGWSSLFEIADNWTGPHARCRLTVCIYILTPRPFMQRWWQRRPSRAQTALTAVSDRCATPASCRALLLNAGPTALQWGHAMIVHVSKRRKNERNETTEKKSHEMRSGWLMDGANFGSFWVKKNSNCYAFIFVHIRWISMTDWAQWWITDKLCLVKRWRIVDWVQIEDQ